MHLSVSFVLELFVSTMRVCGIEGVKSNRVECLVGHRGPVVDEHLINAMFFLGAVRCWLYYVYYSKYNKYVMHCLKIVSESLSNTTLWSFLANRKRYHSESHAGRLECWGATSSTHHNFELREKHDFMHYREALLAHCSLS